MNQRIRELAEQAGMKECSLGYGMPENVLWGENQIKEFAQLIVQECAVYCEGHILPKGMAEENDLNYNDGVMDCAIGLKQHFGV